jgi:predicted ATP-dependent endonuclease of OLD family
MNELEPSYISKINFKNYKSIRDLTIDLHPGLNIIIGQNSSGKTNFVQAVHNVLSESGHHELPIGFEFGFEFMDNSVKLKKKWTGYVKEMDHKRIKGKKIKIYESKLQVGRTKITKESLFHPDIMNELPLLEHILVPFTLPSELPYLKQMGSLDADTSTSVDSDEVWVGYFALEDELGYFAPFVFEARVLYESKENLSKEIETRLKVNDNLVIQLKRFSPIKDCRVANGYTIEIQEDCDGFIINHVIIEFYVNNNWYSWEQLSDGTKRLFYIISKTISNPSLVIIEEPELGLHPDQLFGMMDFLKAQAEYKQIIVTTHSPDALNILEKNELHKIVITRFDTEKGTLMHHLSPKKIAKAHRYMNTEGLELKDFWLHSNLEDLDETK